MDVRSATHLFAIFNKLDCRDPLNLGVSSYLMQWGLDYSKLSIVPPLPRFGKPNLICVPHPLGHLLTLLSAESTGFGALRPAYYTQVPILPFNRVTLDCLVQAVAHIPLKKNYWIFTNLTIKFNNCCWFTRGTVSLLPRTDRTRHRGAKRSRR